MSEAIKDGVFGFVSGTVGRSFQTKNGRAFELEVTSQGAKYPDRWTVWGDLPVREGDRVRVKGWLEVKPDTYEKDGETKHIVRRSINKPEVAAHEPSQQPTQADAWETQAPPVDAWPADASEPF